MDVNGCSQQAVEKVIKGERGTNTRNEGRKKGPALHTQPPPPREEREGRTRTANSRKRDGPKGAPDSTRKTGKKQAGNGPRTAQKVLGHKSPRGTDPQNTGKNPHPKGPRGRSKVPLGPTTRTHAGRGHRPQRPTQEPTQTPRERLKPLALPHRRQRTRLLQLEPNYNGPSSAIRRRFAEATLGRDSEEQRPLEN